MALGLSNGGDGNNDRMPYVKYDARSGRMFRVDRSQGGDGKWQTDDVDISNIAEFVADLANIKVGYIGFGAQGPVKMMVNVGQPLPNKPADGDANFKQGFSLHILLSKACGGGERELSSNAGCVVAAMNELHDLYLSAAESKAGKLPIIKMGAATPIKSAQSTNYKPAMSIVGWVDRPAAMQQVAAPSVVPSAPSTGSTVVPPPAAVPQQAAAMAASDFG
jgi:hypothetical protein